MNTANKISIFRLLLIPLWIGLVSYYGPEKEFLRYLALCVFLVAIFSDMLDGYVARRYNQVSPEGILLDPLADKLLLMSCFFSLYFLKSLTPQVGLPLWALLVLISRDIILLLGGGLILLMGESRLKIRPTWWGKITTFSQACVVVSFLLQWKGTPTILVASVALTIISGMDYITKGMEVLGSDRI